MSFRTYHNRGERVDGYGVREHPIYHVWASMKSRCNNPSEPSYANYGGRGIKYCPRWEHFRNFVDDMGMRPTPNHTIERVDNDGDYEPSNCVWATRTEQSLNRRVFSNNSTGFTGVKKVGGRYIASFQHNGVRYVATNSHCTPEEAHGTYLDIRELVLSGKPTEHLTGRLARYDNRTGVRGVSRRVDGYVVRVTENKKRKYLGIFKTLEEAEARLDEWKLDKI